MTSGVHVWNELSDYYSVGMCCEDSLSSCANAVYLYFYSNKFKVLFQLPTSLVFPKSPIIILLAPASSKCLSVL